MWWELDADKPENTGGALVRTVKEALGPLQQKENELHYPGSSVYLCMPRGPSCKVTEWSTDCV